MKIGDIMTRRPLTAAPGTAAAEVRDLLDDARIHHMPILDGDRLLGLWVGGDDGTLALLGPERVAVLDEDRDATEAVTAILRGQSAVLALEEGTPAGLVTGEDVRRLALSALAHGLSHRGHEPVVVRFVGPAGSGKTTLLLRTIALLHECAIGVVKPADDADPVTSLHVAGETPVVETTGADRMSGLQRAIAALGPVRTVFLEDRPGTDHPAVGLGESLLIAVARPHDLAELSSKLIDECGGLLLSSHGSEDDVDAAMGEITALRPDLPVFVVDAEGDPESLVPWARWLRARILPEAVRRG